MTMLNKAQVDVLEIIDRLEYFLTHLQYEGKLRRGNNLKQIEKLSSLLMKTANEQFRLEEKILFPFLKQHIPKLESLLRLLHAECEVFKAQLKSFKAGLKKFSKKIERSKNSKLTDYLQETAIHLIYFLRNHIQVKQEVIYNSINKDLRADERILLKLQLQTMNQKKGVLCLMLMSMSVTGGIK